jgi:hypothetical protein
MKLKTCLLQKMLPEHKSAYGHNDITQHTTRVVQALQVSLIKTMFLLLKNAVTTEALYIHQSQRRNLLFSTWHHCIGRDMGAGTGTGTGTPIPSNTLPIHLSRYFMSCGYKLPMLPILKQLAFESFPWYITWPENNNNQLCSHSTSYYELHLFFNRTK